MKYASRVVAATLAMAANCAAMADNSAGCWWHPKTTTKEKRYFTFTPTPMTLYLAPIGQKMNSQSFSLSATGGSGVFKCPTTVETVHYGFRIDAPLEDGYSDVYRTNIPGIGLRFVDSNFRRAIPFDRNYPNFAPMAGVLPDPLVMEFIRTRRDVRIGTLNVNFKIRTYVEDWDAAEITIIGPAELSSTNYFSGCAGKQLLEIPLGKIPITFLERQTPHSVSLSVLCTGLLPGSKLPVRIYFEGSNEGSGMLNLTPGGASGVGVALTTPTGVKLPFTKWNGLAMQWLKSEEDGERYTFDFNAKYARKGSAKITPGRADAVLNYILDYN